VIRGDASGDLVFVARAALEQTHRRERRQHPRQFGDFGNVGLFEENGFLRIKTTGEKVEGDVERIFPALRGIEQRRHGMIIGDEIKRLAFVLQLDGRPHHPEIISEMQRAGGLDAGQDSHGGINRKERKEHKEKIVEPLNR
jgi:hypothetical protein